MAANNAMRRGLPQFKVPERNQIEPASSKVGVGVDDIVCFIYPITKKMGSQLGCDM